MSVLRFSFVLMIFLVLGSKFFVSVTFASVSESEATVALANAEGVVVSAFRVVLEAEQTGANVSGLLSRLNEAEGFLAQARVAYNSSAFDEAARFASLGRDIGEEVKNEAYKLKDLARDEGVQRLRFSAIGSLVGVACIIFGSFWCWRFFKRRYSRRVLGMKPEVAPDES